TAAVFRASLPHCGGVRDALLQRHRDRRCAGPGGVVIGERHCRYLRNADGRPLTYSVAAEATVRPAVLILQRSLRRRLRPGCMLPPMLLGFANQLGVLCVVFILAKGLSLPIGFLDCLMVVPVAMLATDAPSR